MKNLVQMLEETVRSYGDRPFIIHDKSRLTYGEFDATVNALAHNLQGMGIEKGDKIAIMLPNCPEFIISYFAAQKIGAVAVTLNILSTAFELQHLLGDSDAKCLIAQDTTERRFEEIRKDLPLCRHLITTRGMDKESAFTAFLKDSPAQLDFPDAEPDDDSVMIYTAGLTGKSLGAVLTHRNLLTQSNMLLWLFKGNHNDRGLAVIPFFHSFGAACNMLSIMRVGASVVLMERFTVESIFNAIQNEKVTYICGVPRLYLGMLLQPGAEKYDTSSLRFCVTGGAPMPPDWIAPFKERFGTVLLEGYGLTEAAPVCSVNRVELPQKLGSIGTIIPVAEARIVDDGGHELPVNTVGELLIRGENVMKGYYKAPEITAQVIRDGWLHTGDLAKIDAEGYIFLTGRKKRMIITSGFNVYPREVEMALEMHPTVKAARVIGKEDLMRGEIVKAQILLQPGAASDEKEIMRHCRVYLSSYKLPREIEFVEKFEE